MTFRIQRSTRSAATIFAISGELANDYIEPLKQLLEAENHRPILLDLEEVTLVGRGAVEFLARIEGADVGIINCPEYVRTWIEADRQGDRP